MLWLLAAFSGIGFVEIFLRLPVRAEISKLIGTAGKSARVIRSTRISDHWKEKVLLVYSGQIFQSTVGVTFRIVLALGPLVGLTILATFLALPLAEFMLSWQGLLFTTIVALAYAKLRVRFVSG